MIDANTRLKEDGIHSDESTSYIKARGVRNSVGFSWHPLTGELWFTDNGVDHLGDLTPDCELNRVQFDGQHFGYPYCHSLGSGDPNYRSVGNVTFVEEPTLAEPKNMSCTEGMYVCEYVKQVC